MIRRQLRLRIVLTLLATLVASTPAAGQDGVVRAAIERTFAALSAGDTDAYLDELSPQARVFIDAGGLVELDAVEWLRRVAPADWVIRDVRTQIIGRRAVSVVEVEGPLRVDGVVDLSGPWRYAETRAFDGGRWRVVQQEVSPLGDATAARPGPSPGDSAFDGQGTAAPSGPQGRSAADPRPTALPSGVTILGPPPPVPPAVISRDAQGNATVRAIRLSAPLDLDGRLDEPVYTEVPPLNEFIQAIPNEGAPASELTEAWIMFDDDNVYVSARMHESVPEREWVANEMRRDLIRTNDNFGLIFDTYYDRRNGYFFYVNPLGAFSDIQVTNEGNPNFDWNPVWEVRSGRFEGGWTVEMRFPFKSLRYRPGTSQVWGLQLRRMIRRRNETSQLTPIPAAAAGNLGSNAILRLSRAATLVGLEAPPPGVNIDVKPYGIAGLTTDRTLTPAVVNDLEADGGVDVKWAISQNLAADFTYNTDFAQVEVDEQQVNLTRFNLFFPEKREFFLESRGIFDFPSGGRGFGGGDGADVLGARSARAFLDHVLDHVTFGERIVVGGGEARAMEEDLLAVLAADEAEAAIAHHLLDAALRLRTRRRAAAAARSRARTRSAVAIARDELLAEQVDRHQQILELVLLGREQHLVLAEIRDRVAETGILVRDPGSGFDLVQDQHGTSFRGADPSLGD